MAKLNTENLFLMEFLVDDLKLSGRCNCGPEDVCVSFQFLDNEPMEVCEGDFNSDGRFGENDTSKTGKSCLFSLTPAQAQKVLATFDVTVKAFKKPQPGWQQGDKSCIGTAKISVLPLFLDLISQVDANAASTPAKVLQETHNLFDCKGMQTAAISVYIRLSCYGKMIVTQFQMNMDDKSVLFKGKDGQSMYRYKKTKKGKPTKIEDMSCRQPAQCFQQPQEQMSQIPQMNSMLPQMYAPQQFPQQQNMNCPVQPCYPNGPMNVQPNMNYPMPNNYPQPNMNNFGNFPDYGQSMYEMGMFPAANRPPQVTYNRKRQARSACSGSCRKNNPL